VEALGPAGLEELVDPEDLASLTLALELEAREEMPVGATQATFNRVAATKVGRQQPPIR
jgi:hypothetical protein